MEAGSGPRSCVDGIEGGGLSKFNELDKTCRVRGDTRGDGNGFQYKGKLDVLVVSFDSGLIE